MYDTTFRKELDFFGDETAGIPILEINAVKPKLYSYMTIDMAEKKKAKGTGKNTVKACATHFHYLWCIRGTSPEAARQMVQYDKLVSHRQQMYTMRLQRALMTAPNSKRYQTDAIHSLPHGFKPEWVPELSNGREAFLDWAGDDCAQPPAKRARTA